MLLSWDGQGGEVGNLSHPAGKPIFHEVLIAYGCSRFLITFRPLIFARVKQHKAADQTQDEMLKFIVYNMEISRTLFPLNSGIETASVGERLFSS